MENKLTRTQKLTRIAIFAGITLLLAVTPLGYIPINVLFLVLPSITIMVLPVVLGGLSIGWPAGFILGLVFGLSSFFRAPTEALGVLMMGISPFATFVVCVVPRVLVGLASDGMGALIRKKNYLHRFLVYGLSGLAASLSNTVLFLGAIWLLFDAEATGVTLPVIMSIVAFNGLVEAATNAIFTAVLGQVLLRKKAGGEGPVEEREVKPPAE